MSEPIVTLTPEQLAQATPEELARYQEYLRLELARSSPLGYAKSVDHTYPTDRPVLRLLDEAIVRAATGQVRKTMLWLPPRTAKSDLGVRKAIAWYHTRYPQRLSAVVSYAVDLAEGHSADARRMIMENPELGCELSAESRSRGRWATVAGGEHFSAGTGGSITGKGINFAIIDDVVKNGEEVVSLRNRDKDHEWYRSTFINRLQDARDGTKWGLLFIMTRWHEDDLAGRLLSEEGYYDPVENPDGWVVVRVPAICDSEDDPLGRAIGEPMQRLVDQTAEDAQRAYDYMRRVQGSYWFSALFQQSPMPDGGGFFKRDDFQYWRPTVVGDKTYIDLGAGKLVANDKLVRFTTVDLAASTKTRADFTVLSTWGVWREPGGTPALILLDRERKRLEGPDQVPMMLRVRDKHSPSYFGVESQGLGLTIVQEAMRNERLVIRPIPADKDKVSRALQAAARVEAHQVYFPRNAEWLGEWESELLAFPVGEHDDQVDTLSMATAELSRVFHALPAEQGEPRTVDERYQAWVTDKRKGATKRKPHPTLGR